jgi:hypothetical protein
MPFGYNCIICGTCQVTWLRCLGPKALRGAGSASSLSTYASYDVLATRLLPEARPSGRTACVQNRSRQFCHQLAASPKAPTVGARGLTAMDGRNAENAGAIFCPSDRSSRIDPCHSLVVIVYTRIIRTGGDLPTEDFHLMS